MNIKIPFGILLLVLALSCQPLHPYNYQFSKAQETSYPVVQPCEPEAIVKFKPDQEKAYTLIGYCEAKARSGSGKERGKNNAMEAIKVCACKNGGQLIKILSHDEVSRLVGDARGLVPNNTEVSIDLFKREISKDKLYTAIYVKK